MISSVFEATRTYTISFMTSMTAVYASAEGELNVDNVQVVPEPATASLLIVPGLIIAFYRRFFGKV